MAKLNKVVDFDKKYEPNNRRAWMIKLFSEFFGTIFLTWMIGLLGVTFGGIKFETLLSGNGDDYLSNLTIGFWVALDILICLFVFSRWSCDLNPAVTAYRIISKGNTRKYGYSKIAVQFIAAFAAGGLILLTQYISSQVSGGEYDGIYSDKNTWSAFRANEAPGPTDSNSFARHIVAFLGELAGTIILLWAIFTKSIKSPAVHDIVIVMIVGFGVAALLELSTVGWNPARTLATNYIFDIVKGGTSGMQLYWAYLFGPIVAAYVLYYGTIGFHKYVAPAWEKAISWRKVD